MDTSAHGRRRWPMIAVTAVRGTGLAPVAPDLSRLRERAAQAQGRFDRRAGQAPDEVASWGLDPRTGRMVADVIGSETPETRAFTADGDPAAVAVRTGRRPRAVFGLIRSSACAERGDSGGTFVTPAGQAQGLLSGGSGDCVTGGATFYEPIRDALNAYGRG